MTQIAPTEARIPVSLGETAERERDDDQRQAGEPEEADQPDAGAIDLHRYPSSSHSRRIRAATSRRRRAEGLEPGAVEVVALDAAEQGAVTELEGEIGRRLGREPVDSAGEKSWRIQFGSWKGLMLTA